MIGTSICASFLTVAQNTYSNRYLDVGFLFHQLAMSTRTVADTSITRILPYMGHISWYLDMGFLCNDCLEFGISMQELAIAIVRFQIRRDSHLWAQHLAWEKTLKTRKNCHHIKR